LPSGRLDPKFLLENLNDQVAAVCYQSPNAFGVIEDLAPLQEKIRNSGALTVTCFSEALALGFLNPPGRHGADIVVGEGASFGNFLNFGGPYLGLFATRKDYVRQMPGRLVGETIDVEGKRGFVLVLSTREQHIRREKATSNICTNQALCALATAVYLSLMGKQGLKKVAEMNYGYAHYLREGLAKLPGVQRRFSGGNFNEFVLKLPVDAERVLTTLRQAEIFGGISVAGWGSGLENCILVCATEMNTKQQMDRYIQIMKVIL
jgi:glycine dehydrogenase subunit 1